MALLFRPCINKSSINGIFNRLCKVPKHNNVQIARISGRLNRSDRVRYPPYPYKTKKVSRFDNALKRFDENTRLIVVEGPIASGKDKFARNLAVQLGMAYMPSPSFDILYANKDGLDIRSLNHLLPEVAQCCDITHFLSNPHHVNIAAFQASYLMLKVNAYIESMLHILSTGEGVVMNRCFISDPVFMEAMINAGYVNRRCFECYQTILSNMAAYLLRPHLVIYLDVPVNIVQENIKKRCIPYEVNSKALTKEYLTDIENLYKTNYLPYIENHSYLLMYDWSHGGDMEDVVEDIECINMEYDSRLPDKLVDWIFSNNESVNDYRVLYSREERDEILMSSTLLEYANIPEFFLTGPDVDKCIEIRDKHLPEYEKGFNPKEGDSVLWKWTYEDKAVYPNVITNQELLAAS